VNGARLALGPLFACLGACSATIQARPADDFAPFTALRAEHYPGAAAILSGMAPPDDDRRLRVGDAALFAVDLQNGEQRQRELLLLEVVDRGGAQGERKVANAKITATVNGETTTHWLVLHEVTLALRRFDPAGRETAPSRLTLYEEALCAGWWPDTLLHADRRQHNLAFLMTMSLQNLLDGDPTLQELLFLVVDRPSLFSIATHLGVNVNVATSLDMHPRRPPPFAGLPPGTEVAVTNKDLRINGAQALWADLFVTPPKGALGVCGGLLGAVARNAEDPTRTAALRLLATRRAPQQ
jgi:hypothetical protein